MSHGPCSKLLRDGDAVVRVQKLACPSWRSAELSRYAVLLGGALNDGGGCGGLGGSGECQGGKEGKSAAGSRLVHGIFWLACAGL
ncbi:hypothetical protein HNQ08_002941 [Deinococcus humi]|uniref:Uncharacterized protein n=1 Tax=Deinococcus humi TaxID=662880 RepID=A0A7W8JY50_9DEIO|nr:hypothetical protein [Deinococcus humi]